MAKVFMVKSLRMTRSYAPTTSYGFFSVFRTAKDTGCNEVKHLVAAQEERPLKKCDISEGVINVSAILLYGFIATVLSTNSEPKHFPSISLVSSAVIVIPIREWDMVGNHEERQLFLDKLKKQYLWAG